MKQSHKTLLLWVLLILMFVAIWTMVSSHSEPPRAVAFTEFVTDIQEGKVTEVVVRTQDATGHYRYRVRGADGERPEPQPRETFGILSDQVNEMLMNSGARVEYQPKEENILAGALLTWLPMLFLLGIFFFFMRQLQASGGKAMSFGKSKARLLNESQNKVTFADVAGIDEAKDDCEEIIAFLKDPKKFQRLGGRIPKGVLLMGAPGTGKTLLARAIAGEAGVPFFSISGSDFVEMFVGVGASRVRDLFEQGKKHAPCIIFIDEIDAVGRHRGSGLGGGHDEREQTLNQLLVEMDGFESTDGVIIVAATNRPDVLDPAILRPGRFDRRIIVARPDLGGRLGILQVHTRKVPLHDDVELEIIARGCPGFSGADLENLVNEAALLAARQDKDFVSMQDFEMAKDKVLMGSERRSMVISEKEKKTTAYHEAGHTLVANLLPNHDPIHKVTIIPRGPALGVTMSLPSEERLSYSAAWVRDRIAMALGGRIAEEIVFGQLTTGASDDFKKATQLARSMVTEWGMSEKLGPLAYVEKEDSGFLGSNHHKDYSEETAKEIDDEVRTIIREQYARARSLLEANRDKLEAIAEALLERETLDREEIEAVMGGGPLPPNRHIIVPSYAEKRRDQKDKKKGSIFQPRPREVPTPG
ncbi:MAG: ATP-dependent zinc metalloprotease FtsH [Sandaracinaceae bacterium]|nr:ATP-dependent zinc metalloprotease FtsH [Sandaracinaceae bacterium]MBK7773008.1 ATP-dependent zinc metalloprotease FtsH [Sandaracinaceae bacterium]MBK8407217.1 ATP-dependent zinc metalloprotease FtsH [Sandaracinaceae bacterium]MBK8588705.1 ATP-dependent zinc metalloprotease FtsH [Sandaracinaceae bacterium]MBP7680741.1 ATP-dependent zinc metalloprotease FtsH [Deltaproteobacteria bacterium]